VKEHIEARITALRAEADGLLQAAATRKAELDRALDEYNQWAMAAQKRVNECLGAAAELEALLAPPTPEA
jgi:hypothetical protein